MKLKRHLKNSLQSTVGAVEKVMIGLSGGMVKDWKARE